ncbi:C40 family peptidase [Desulfotomaculum sp. 1211_IL3151]|uniref:C40 family peptidase n=1 Tax=Desulfotomaculum sp. 1211_IL3151 TaxID=3084055 RepID=UPI002FDA2A57
MMDLREVEVGTTVITSVSVADILEQPEAGVPLVTQQLMGWPALVMGVEGDWLHLQCHDGSPGWGKVDHFCLSKWPQEAVAIQVTKPAAGLSRHPLCTSDRFCTLFMGSILPVVGQENQRLRVVLPGKKYAFLDKDATNMMPQGGFGQSKGVLMAAGLLAGAPYLWGGMTVRGFDCSGLTYMAYFSNGYQLPRDCQDQFKVGKPVQKEELTEGDLVFFSTIEPGPSHVGIYQGDGLFINARSKEGVTVTSFNDHFFSGRYLGARRYL